MKRWKLSYEDFRNRRRWDDYAEAADEMFEKTSTRNSPWTLIPANNKKHARIAAMETIVKCFGNGTRLSPPVLDERVVNEARAHFDLDSSMVERLVGRTE